MLEAPVPVQIARHVEAQLAGTTSGAPGRRRLPEVPSSPGLYVEAFPTYGSASAPTALPIPSNVLPATVATTPNISFPAKSNSDLCKLAGASIYFGLRFTGGAGRETTTACLD